MLHDLTSEAKELVYRAILCLNDEDLEQFYEEVEELLHGC